MSMPTLLPWLLVIPLLGALLGLLLPAAWAARVALAGLPLPLLAAVALWRQVAEAGPQRHAIGGWQPPLGIELQADALSALMALLSAAVVLAVALYARGTLGSAPYARHFWALLWFVLAALNGIWLSADLFNLYVGLELLSLAAVALVAIEATPAALAAALRYLLLALFGALLYLLGVVLVYDQVGSLALADLAGAAPGAGASTALALMIAGLLLKTALWPLHGWLPPAHGGALTPVSALLSALVVKASFYILLRLWQQADALLTPALAGLLGGFGAVAIFWGGVLALRQPRLKMLVAYSTVAQLGYLFLFFPLALGAHADLAWNGTLLQLVAHALAKAALFMAAGNLILSCGGAGVKDLSGLGRHNLLALASFALAGVSLMGLPPSGGFLAKWLLLQSALGSGQWGWAAVLLGGSLLTAAYVFRVLRQPFLLAATPGECRRLPRALHWPPLLLALAALLLGLLPAGLWLPEAGR